MDEITRQQIVDLFQELESIRVEGCGSKELESYNKRIELAEQILKFNAVGEWIHSMTLQYAEMDYADRGRCLLLLSDLPDYEGVYKQVIQDFNRAIEIKKRRNQDPSPGHYENRACGYLDSKAFALALKDAMRVVELAPKDYTSYCLRSTCYRMLGNYEKAMDDANRAIEVAHNSYVQATAYHERGLVYDAMGNQVAASNDFEQADNLRQQKTWDMDTVYLVSETAVCQATLKVIEPATCRRQPSPSGRNVNRHQ
jgi:tetratricopeptide (TPR) repeat protein